MKLLYKPKSDWHKRKDMTSGKIYEGDYVDGPVYSSDGIYYTLISDMGEDIYIHESHIVEVQKNRDIKLKNLGI